MRSQFYEQVKAFWLLDDAAWDLRSRGERAFFGLSYLRAKEQGRTCLPPGTRRFLRSDGTSSQNDPLFHDPTDFIDHQGDRPVGTSATAEALNGNGFHQTPPSAATQDHYNQVPFQVHRELT